MASIASEIIDGKKKSKRNSKENGEVNNALMLHDRLWSEKEKHIHDT